MHYLEATFRLALQNKGFQNPIEVAFISGQLADHKRFQVCRNGYNLAKDLSNLGLTKITRFKDHERFFVLIEYCNEPSV